MAEALLNRIDSEHFEAVSAGTSRRELHHCTVEVMKEVGIDLSQKALKRVEDLAEDKFDYVITLDDSAARAYRNFRRAATIHWKFDDPTSFADPAKQLRVFRMVRDQI